MGYAKLSVTIPDETYKEIKELASRKNMKVSRLVSDALAEMVRKMREQAIIERINTVFEDSHAAEEHRLMGEMIAENTEVEELPW
ncbi:MAG: hypothetical protein ACLFUT_04905 [Desulfobacteraceae bacterium]